MNTEMETIDAKAPTLFGYPVEVSLKVSDRETVDITHALQWDGKDITLDQAAVTDAIQGAHMRGFGLSEQQST